MDDGRIPEFLWLEDQLSQQELDQALDELEASQLGDFARTVIWTLAYLTPRERLRRAISKAARVLSWHPVSDILGDGLLPAERDVLLELDDLGISDQSKAVVHQLLGLKERWIFNKCMSKLFTRARRSGVQCEGAYCGRKGATDGKKEGEW